MKCFRLSALVAVAVALSLAATSFGQEGGARGARGAPGRGFGGMFGVGGMDKARLLSSDQVRKEVKITEEQAQKIQEILTAYREESRGLFSGMRDLSPEEREKARAEVTKKRAELLKKVDGKLAAVLEKSQTKRLNEILLQQQGVDGLTSEYAVTGLKLSKEQVGKIKAAIEARDQETRKMMADMRGSRAGGGDRSGFAQIREKMQEVRKKAEANVLAALTEEQKKGLEKLKGEKFELQRGPMRGSRGGPEGGAPGGRRRPGGQGGQPPE